MRNDKYTLPRIFEVRSLFWTHQLLEGLKINLIWAVPKIHFRWLPAPVQNAHTPSYGLEYCICDSSVHPTTLYFGCSSTDSVFSQQKAWYSVLESIYFCMSPGVWTILSRNSGVLGVPKANGKYIVVLKLQVSNYVCFTYFGSVLRAARPHMFTLSNPKMLKKSQILEM